MTGTLIPGGKGNGADAAVVTSVEPTGGAHADATKVVAGSRLAVVVDELALVRLGLVTLLGSVGGARTVS